MDNWIDLIDAAYAALRTAHLHSALGSLDMIFVLVKQRFGHPWSMEIFDFPQPSDQYNVAIAKWERSTDHPDAEAIERLGIEPGTAEYWDAFRAAMPDRPTIARSLHQIPRTPVDEFAKAFRRHVFPVVEPVWSDWEVSTFEFRFGNSATGILFNWIEAGPEEWREPIKDVLQFLETVKQFLPLPEC